MKPVSFDGFDWVHYLAAGLLILSSLGIHISVDQNSIIGKIVPVAKTVIAAATPTD